MAGVGFSVGKASVVGLTVGVGAIADEPVAADGLIVASVLAAADEPGIIVWLAVANGLTDAVRLAVSDGLIVADEPGVANGLGVVSGRSRSCRFVSLEIPLEYNPVRK